MLGAARLHIGDARVRALQRGQRVRDVLRAHSLVDRKDCSGICNGLVMQGQEIKTADKNEWDLVDVLLAFSSAIRFAELTASCTSGKVSCKKNTT